MDIIRNGTELRMHNASTDRVLRDNPTAMLRARDHNLARLVWWEGLAVSDRVKFNRMFGGPPTRDHR